jgi:large subunit ribosomal protein L4
VSKADVLSPAGKKAGSVELDDAVFGLEPNIPLMAQVVTAQLAARRAGTQSTKTRSEARGGGAKPWRQKGTGRARAGSSRSPIWVGGGVAHGPKPRKYDQKTPKKMVKLALRSALSDRASEGKILVVDEWKFDTPSTKQAKAALAAIKAEGNVLLVITEDDFVAARSFRNLPEVQVILDRELNAYDVLCNDVIVFTKANLPSTAAAAPAAEADEAPAKPAKAKAKAEKADAEPVAEADDEHAESAKHAEADAEEESK